MSYRLLFLDNRPFISYIRLPESYAYRGICAKGAITYALRLLLEKHVLVTLFVMALMPWPGSAQMYLIDIGGGIGTGHYLGDIGGTESEVNNFSFRDIQTGQSRWNANGFIRYRPAYRLGLVGQASYLRISGADSDSPTPHSRTNRNLSFRNDIYELSAKAEGYFLIINDLGGKGRYAADLHMYGMIGLGLFYHNPQAQLDGTWHNLQPLTTEGPDKQYSLLQPSVPFGGGAFVTFKANQREKLRRHRIGFELSMRLTTTDYLDDVSTVYPEYDVLPNQVAKDIYARRWELNGANELRNDDPKNRPKAGGKRGNPEYNDWFFTMSFSYSYVIKTHSGKFSQPRYGYVYGKSRRSRSSKTKY